MSAPLIDAIEAPAEVEKGQAVTVTVKATDPDAHQATITATVTNPAGEATTQAVAVTVGAGTLTYALACDDPAVTITPGAAPGEYNVQF